MRKLKKYERFKESQDLKEILKLNENRGMANCNSKEFKNLFSEKITESNYFTDESLVEKAHAYYELSMLLESRPNWFEDNKNICYIDSYDYLILIKNSEAFIIEKKTIDLCKENMDWVKEVSSLEIIKENITPINEGFFSKCYDLAKTMINGISKYFEEKVSWGEMISFIVSVVSAILGLFGAGIPGLTIAAGILMALNGSYHIYHGMHTFKEVRKKMNEMPELKNLSNVSKSIAAGVKVAPEFIQAGLAIAMGVFDVTKGLSEALVNPASGSVSMGIKHGLEKATHVNVIGHWIEGAFEKLFHSFGKEIAEYLAKCAFGAFPIIMALIAEPICGWLWNLLLTGIGKLADGISFIASIPKKCREMIEGFDKFADTQGRFSAAYIIAGGLNKLAKPLISKVENFCENYAKPAMDKVSNWVNEQKEAAELIEKHGIKKEIKTEGLKKVDEVKQPIANPSKAGDKLKIEIDGKISKEPPPPEQLKVKDGEDKEALAKAKEEGLIKKEGEKKKEEEPQEAQKESISFNNKRLKRYLDYKNSK